LNQKSRQLFLSSKNGSDLLGAINQRINETNLENKTSTPTVTEGRFYYLIYKCKNRFKSYKLPKKRGGFREITAPISEYKIILRLLKDILEDVFQVGPLAHGFVKNRSIVSNAKKHVGRNFILNVDLQDFFPSINFGRVSAIFRLNPFNFGKDQADLIAHICCNNRVLPQGAPTSPIISNIICQRLDRKITRLGANRKSQATRYCDDITFSSNNQIFDSDFILELSMIINSEGFELNPLKTRVLSSKQRQEVTGIIVNKKMNITSQKKGEIRWLIKLWEKRGKASAQEWLEQNYKHKSRYGGSVPDLASVLEGNLSFMKMVTGPNRLSYVRLAKRLDDLLKLDLNPHINLGDIESKLKIIREHLGSNPKENRFEIAISLIDFYNSFHLENNAKHLVDESVKTFSQFILKEGSRYSSKRVISEAKQFLLPPLDLELFDKAKSTGKGRWRDGKAPDMHENLAVLNLFRNTSQPLGYIFHENSEKSYKTIVNESLIFIDNNLNDIGNRLNFRVKKETYEVVSLLFRKLKHLLNEGLLDNLRFSEVMKNTKYALTLNSFKKLTRFGNIGTQTRISHAIYHAFVDAGLRQNKFPILKIPEDIDSIFQDILAPVYTVHDGIKIIFIIIDQHTSSKGAIQISVREWNNKVVLRIINLNSHPEQSIEAIMRGLDSGDINSLRDVLMGVCELNIISKPQNDIPYKINILPSTMYSSHDENPYSLPGTTFELIFHRTYRVLIIDDADRGSRINSLKENYDASKYNLFQILFKSEIESTLDLKGYNLVCVHQSQNKGVTFQRIHQQLKNENTPTIIFGGGCEAQEVSSKIILLPVDVFQDKFTTICDHFSTHKPQNVSNIIEKITPARRKEINTKIELIDHIHSKEVTFPLAEATIIAKVKEITKQDNLPVFEKTEDLVFFIEHV
jgi:RNA-directed DNA polymerase